MYTINLNEDDLFIIKIALNSSVKHCKEIIDVLGILILTKGFLLLESL